MASLAPSLVRARTIINSRWPDRDRALDGWIGDAAHQARNSDHNPNGRGIVDAIDVDMFGGPTPVSRVAIVAAGLLHPAISYVIFNRAIFQSSDGFRPRAYNGINPHTEHCHYSIKQTMTAEQSSAPWSMLVGWPTWNVSLRRGVALTTQSVRELQAFLNTYGAWSLVIDGSFGALTDDAVRRFQASRGIAVDGIVGPITRGHLFS